MSDSEAHCEKKKSHKLRKLPEDVAKLQSDNAAEPKKKKRKIQKATEENVANLAEKLMKKAEKAKAEKKRKEKAEGYRNRGGTRR